MAAGGFRTGVVELREARAETNRYVVPVETPGARRWSPDTPHLYTARVTLRVGGEVVERRDTAFGVRSFTMDEQPDERGLAGALRLDGERIILRGANTMGFLQLDVQRGDDEQLIDDILICRMANMNFLRITQRPIQRRAYEAMDALGLMHQCDLPMFGVMRRGTEAEIVKQAGEMERRVRRHPSCIIASIINEPSPYAWNQQRHRTLFRHEMELMFEACRRVILLENPDRILKATDGDYDPPTAFGLPDHHMYARWHPGHGPWGDRYRGELPPTKVGWRLGCGEYGAEGLDAWETAKACYPEAWLPPGLDPDAQWKPSSIPSSQAVGWSRYWFDPGHSYRTWYDATNTYMAEAIAEMNYAWRRRADRIVSTAVHLAVDAWPSTFLKAMVDTQRRPKPSYFAYRDSISPVAVNLRCDRRQVYAGETAEVELHVLNDTPRRVEGWRVDWRVTGGGGVLAGGGVGASCDGCFSKAVGRIRFTCPETQDLETVVVTALLRDGGARRGTSTRARWRSSPGKRRRAAASRCSVRMTARRRRWRRRSGWNGLRSVRTRRHNSSWSTRPKRSTPRVKPCGTRSMPGRASGSSSSRRRPRRQRPGASPTAPGSRSKPTRPTTAASTSAAATTPSLNASPPATGSWSTTRPPTAPASSRTAGTSPRASTPPRRSSRPACATLTSARAGRSPSP